jgi:hypothetical protein
MLNIPKSIGHKNALLSIFVDSIQIFAVKDGVEQSCSFSVELVWGRLFF